MNPFENLLARAPSSVPGPEANETLWKIRGQLEEEFGSAVLYEVVIPEAASWPDFLAHTMPRMTEHFEAKGLTMLGGAATLVAVWRASRLYLFESRRFFAAIQEIEQLDEGGLWARIGEWRGAAGLSIPRESAHSKKLTVPHERALVIPVKANDTSIPELSHPPGEKDDQADGASAADGLVGMGAEPEKPHPGSERS